jgi:hypothetical protein
VATELQSLHLQIDADPRLAAAVGGVARYLADAAGLENGAISQLQSSIVAACQEEFECLTVEHRHLEVNVTRYVDRIEVALSHQRQSSPAAGLGKVAGLVAPIRSGRGKSVVFAGIDRVQFETHGDEAVTRLTKYIGAAAPGI